MQMNDRIKLAREEAGLTQDALAALCNKTRGAVTQWESGKTRPRRELVAIIAAATGKSVGWIERGVEEKEGGASAMPLYAVGEVAGGLWKEGSAEYKPVRVPVSPHPDYPPECQRLYIVRGSSVNRVVADGEYIHCVEIYNSGVKPQHGDLVVVKRVSHDLAEYTAKRLIKDGEKWILRPESHDPSWQDDIIINGDDGTEVEITDIVIAKWSPISRIR